LLRIDGPLFTHTRHALRRLCSARKKDRMKRTAGFASLGIAALAAAAVFATSAVAQQRPGVSLDKRWPGQSEQQPEPELQQQQQPAPKRGQRAPQTTQSTSPAQPVPTGIKPQPAPPRVVACSGVFAKDSSHLKLATFFGAHAIAWTQVAGPEGSQLNASVLYQGEPKRRLEVLWNNDSARSDTQLIVINGQSTWTAPHGLKLGMPLAAVEKINKKPFNLRAFSGENGGYVTSWDGGALASLPGGCKISIRFAPDPKAKPSSEAPLEGDKEYPSGHPGMKASGPKISEIILGY
jgi:hypothetical protein